MIVVDSVSHEWSGTGGCLDMQDAELDRMAGGDWKKREACKMAAWIKPKTSHKHMVQRLLQVRAHLILCFRAEEKIEMIRGDDGKMKIVPKVTATGIDGWVPICEKNLPYELTASFLLMASAPGVPKPIKLQEQHRALFPLDRPITEESGKRIAEWASGGKSERAAPPPAAADGAPPIATEGEAFDPLIVQAREWAEQGVDGYRAFWTKLTAEQRKRIGEARHEAFKALAETATQAA